jgi:tripartite-type tricarboxylate transporter receptor subunit TctC
VKPLSITTKLAAACMTLAAGLFGTASAQADSWPSKPVRVIVGYPAGTSPDLVARAVQPALSQALGQPVVIENRAGAGGNIGVDLVARASDDHTFGFTTNGPLTTSELLYSKLPFNVAKDLKPISLAATSATVLVTDTKVPATNVKEFIAWAKAQSKAVSYGSIGPGTGSHLTMELFASRAGLNTLHVPYQGFPAITQAIIAHDLQSAFMAPSGALAQAKAGRVNVLGISSSERSPQFPEVPTIAEAAGIPGFNAELWIAAFGPKGMPDAVANRLSKALDTVLKSQDVREKLGAQGWTSRGGTPQDLSKRIADDNQLWGDVIRRANVRIE